MSYLPSCVNAVPIQPASLSYRNQRAEALRMYSFYTLEILNVVIFSQKYKK